MFDVRFPKLSLEFSRLNIKEVTDLPPLTAMAAENWLKTAEHSKNL